MASYIFSYKAIDDLTEIWDYTLVVWSEEQADKYYLEFINSCAEISENPKLGTIYSEIDEGILGFKSNRHIIFYRTNTSGIVEIIRVLPEKMDLKSRLGEP
jgi:toxin ParE1/3/4